VEDAVRPVIELGEHIDGADVFTDRLGDGVAEALQGQHGLFGFRLSVGQRRRVEAFFAVRARKRAPSLRQTDCR
jgi:hypothetical protein